MVSDDFGQKVDTHMKDGDTIVSTDGGFPALAKKGSVYDFLEIDATSGGLKVDIVDATGITVDVDVEQYADGDSDTGAEKGNIALGSDGSNFYYLTTDAAGHLQVDLASSIPAGSNNIGDVDVATIAAGTNTIGKVYVTDGTDDWSIDGSGFGQIDIAAQSLTAVAVSADNNANAAGNPLSVAVGDGTTEADVLSGTLDALYVAITDGTNVMPTMDANSRAGFVQVTDGTDELAINGDGSLNVVSTRGDTVWSTGSATLVKDTPNTVHSYSPGAATDKVIGVLVSGFGLCEWNIKFGTTSSEATIAVIRTTPSSPTEMFAFPEMLEVAAAETILVSATNKENAASTASDFTGNVTFIYQD